MDELTDLKGFPMVIAVSEEAINRQMLKVHNENANKPDKFPNVPWKLEPREGDDMWSVNVDSFEAPEVDFNTDLKQSCRLKMTVIKGNFSISSVKRVNGKPTIVNIDTPLDGLVINVITPMKKISHKKFDDNLFSVQSLFIDLSGIHSVELHTNNEMKDVIAGTPKVALEGLLFERFKTIGEKDPKALIFGLVSIPNVQQTTGPLVPSELSYSTNQITNRTGYKSGTLNYLLSTKDLPKPTTGETIGEFNKTLLQPKCDASFVISEATVLDTVARALVESDFSTAKMALDRRVGKNSQVTSYTRI